MTTKISAWDKMSILAEIVCHDCKHVALEILYEKGIDGCCPKDLAKFGGINIYPGFFCYNHEERDSPTSEFKGEK